MSVYGPWVTPEAEPDTEVAMHLVEHLLSGQEESWAASNNSLGPATTSDLGWTVPGDINSGASPAAANLEADPPDRYSSGAEGFYTWDQITITVTEARPTTMFTVALPPGATGVEYEGGAPVAALSDLRLTGTLLFYESTGRFFYGPDGYAFETSVVGQMSVNAGALSTRDSGLAWPAVLTRTVILPGKPAQLLPDGSHAEVATRYPVPVDVPVAAVPLTVGVISSALTSPYPPPLPPADDGHSGSMDHRILLQLDEWHLAATLTWPRYRFVYPDARAKTVRVKQRDDGLGPSSTRVKGVSSRQRSTRVKGYS